MPHRSHLWHAEKQTAFAIKSTIAVIGSLWLQQMLKPLAYRSPQAAHGTEESYRRQFHGDGPGPGGAFFRQPFGALQPPRSLTFWLLILEVSDAWGARDPAARPVNQGAHGNAAAGRIPALVASLCPTDTPVPSLGSHPHGFNSFMETSRPRLSATQKLKPRPQSHTIRFSKQKRRLEPYQCRTHKEENTFNYSQRTFREPVESVASTSAVRGQVLDPTHK